MSSLLPPPGTDLPKDPQEASYSFASLPHAHLCSVYHTPLLAELSALCQRHFCLRQCPVNQVLAWPSGRPEKGIMSVPQNSEESVELDLGSVEQTIFLTAEAFFWSQISPDSHKFWHYSVAFFFPLRLQPFHETSVRPSFCLFSLPASLLYNTLASYHTLILLHNLQPP